MAGNVKGITIEFDATTDKLNKALKDVKKQASDTQKELTSINRALKFNPGNVELLKQKAEALKQQITQTTDKLKLLKQQQAQMDAQNVDKQSAEYRKLQREIIESESKLKTFNAESKKVQAAISPLGQFSSKMQDIGNKLNSAASAMRGFSMAGAAVAGSIGGLAVKSAQWSDDIITYSKIYGQSTDELQKYNAAAQLVDVNAGAISKTHRKLERNMLNAQLGSTKQALAFEQLGVAYENADGSLRSSDEVWTEVIAALGAMENETERDAYAMALLGRQATELNPIIEDQGESYKLLTDAMQKYDLEFVDEETLQRANDFNDQLDIMKALGLVALQNLGATLSAYLLPVLEKAVTVVGKFANWLSKLDPRILTIIGVVGGLVAAIAPVLMILGKLAFAISSISGLFAMLGTTFGAVAAAAAPWIAAIAAIIAIGVLLYQHWDEIKAKALEVWEAIRQIILARVNAIQAVIQNVVNAIKTIWNGLQSIPAVVQGIFNRVKTAITAPVQTAMSIIKGIIDKIKSFFNFKVPTPKIPLPHFAIHPSGWKLRDLLEGSIPSLSIDWYAKGGVFSAPSIIGVGEAGSEAVVPLDKLWTQMNAMADSIVNGIATAQSFGQSGQPINITLYAFPGGAEMESWVVNTYDRGKRRLG